VPSVNPAAAEAGRAKANERTGWRHCAVLSTLRNGDEVNSTGELGKTHADDHWSSP
jgi:hypothetical protein